MRRWESWMKYVVAGTIALILAWNETVAQRATLMFAVLCWLEIITHRNNSEPTP